MAINQEKENPHMEPIKFMLLYMIMMHVQMKILHSVLEIY
jgi:hypothetical protein